MSRMRIKSRLARVCRKKVKIREKTKSRRRKRKISGKFVKFTEKRCGSEKKIVVVKFIEKKSGVEKN